MQKGVHIFFVSIFCILCFFSGKLLYDFFSNSSDPVLTETMVGLSGMNSVQHLSNKLGDPSVSWSQIIRDQEKESKKNIDARRELAFARSLLGNLSGAEKDIDIYCAQKNIPSVCSKTKFDFEIQNAIDESGKDIGWVNFEVLGKEGTRSQSNNTTVDLYKNTVFRTKVSKKWYTDFIKTEKFVTWPNEEIPTKKIVQKPVMISAQSAESLDPWETFQVKTAHYTFEGSYESFVHPLGGEIEGVIDVYFFDLGRDIKNFTESWLLSLDIFDDQESLLGFWMNTFGMPLVKAYMGDLELHINPENPLRVLWKLQNHDDYLYMVGKQEKTSEEVYAALPPGALITIDNAEELGMPPFWRLNKNTGIWSDSSYTLLDKEGTIQTLLY
jgi:hypothetical protein